MIGTGFWSNGKKRSWGCAPIGARHSRAGLQVVPSPSTSSGQALRDSFFHSCLRTTISKENFSSSFNLRAPPATETSFML